MRPRFCGSGKDVQMFSGWTYLSTKSYLCMRPNPMVKVDLSNQWCLCRKLRLGLRASTLMSDQNEHFLLFGSVEDLVDCWSFQVNKTGRYSVCAID
jgi:hypothetical protein